LRRWRVEFRPVFVAAEACRAVAFGAKAGNEAHFKCRMKNGKIFQSFLTSAATGIEIFPVTFGWFFFSNGWNEEFAT